MTGTPRKISSTYLQRQIGLVIDVVRAGDIVIVESHGRPIVAILSIAEYEGLCAAKRQVAMQREASREEATTAR